MIPGIAPVSGTRHNTPELSNGQPVMIRALRTLVLAIGTLGSLATAVDALPMAPEACDQAKAEQTSLETSGVARDMAQGPEWARANLSVDRLQRVARWIELEEQILFRCPRPAPPPEPATVAAPAPGGKPEKSKLDQKPKPKPATLSETGDAGEIPPKPAKPKPPVAKKPKADDAYRSPSPYSGEDVQHAIPGLPGQPTGGASLAP
ncbi:MAG: hypothetical protein B7Y80_14470 [Hyphomicrobium sp. 32-62-53]|nr:MAG: hypothetical protein B7Z29_16005 [Hyphomicrobium sp. 12-62-95]OYX98691.1 MAG: hypothetical protein B7Y80_14470 [Hyphomicrobium sp. 32-62-53]